MKTAFMILVVAFLALAIGCGGGSKSVKGTWEMVYPESEDGSEATRNTKLLTDTHFAFGSPSARGGIFAGGGTYTLSDSTYTEFIQYHTIPWLIGQKLEFKYLIEDGKWYHSGSFDIDGHKFTVNEVWQRAGE